MLRPWWRWFFRLKLRARGWLPFTAWLVFQCFGHRKRAVIVCRCGGIGDILCSLPVCDELRRRHPGKLVVFITAPMWREVVRLSQAADLVFASRWWVYPFAFPTDNKILGLVVAAYNPRTTAERSSGSGGTTAHLIDDLAASCGITSQGVVRRLQVPARLVESARVRYGLDCKQTKADRLLIAINPGPNWPIKEWEASKWQMLIDKIHSEYDALIIQFGINKGDGSSDYDHLTGVKSLAARLKGEELLALIAQCDLVVSIDSGPLHLAGAVGTPAVGLFGPMNPVSILSPKSQTPALGLVSDVPCLFCHNRTPVLHWITGCPYDIACMKRLECEVVFEAVKSMLELTRKREIKEPLARFD